ncbi:MAG: RNA polymerase sigma factor [Bacteroidia bacterium]|nr:RNA polymerase sigma factor [Bacteroidales bacterium]MDD3011838.1 RNA polymerase sigma factor [Bacteroidales bacterium]MDD3960335.1 RNA polymerase sigma factor [Bacteroidales bacterium]NCD42966.1 RNA polymerase sigma factor [Bacteroidia bacterium]
MTTLQYNTCVNNYADAVYRFILKHIHDNDKAQDIVQEAYTRLWEKVSDVNAEKAKSYLFTTAYHYMIDTIRKDKKQTVLDLMPEMSGKSKNAYSDLKSILNEGMRHLPEIQKTVLMLRDYEGYSYEEIGEITSLNESQVKVYIFRARKTLRNYIGKLENVI